MIFNPAITEPVATPRPYCLDVRGTGRRCRPAGIGREYEFAIKAATGNPQNPSFAKVGFLGESTIVGCTSINATEVLQKMLSTSSPG
jgi:hypothetical protein